MLIKRIYVNIMDRLDVKYKIYVDIMDWLDVQKSWTSSFVGVDAQRGYVGVSFYFFFKNKLYVSFGGRLSFPLFQKISSFPYFMLLKKVCGCWVHIYGYFWVHVYAFWVHVYAFWVHVCGCWVHVCGCWVQSLRLRLGACLTVGGLPDSR